MNKLYRSYNNRVLSGVCGGLGEYFEIDSTLIRVVFTILAVWGGIGLLIYLILLVVMPVNPEHNQLKKSTENELSHQILKNTSKVNRNWIGLSIILLGVLYLFDSLNRQYLFIPLFDLRTILFPLLIIFFGIWVISRNRT